MCVFPFVVRLDSAGAAMDVDEGIVKKQWFWARFL